jgi:hypothetical protein
MIPLCDLKQQYLSLKAEIDAAMQAVAQQGRYILGPTIHVHHHRNCEGSAWLQRP